MTRSKRCIFIATLMSCLVIALAGCAGPRYDNLPMAPAGVTPEAPLADTLPDYRIQIGDVLDLKFYLNPELDETITVRPDGMISTKVADNVIAYDRTVSELNGTLREVYKKELRTPRMSVIVRSFAPIRVYVSGEVVSPGEFISVGQAPTLTQIIARAGGIRNSGAADRILIVRRGMSDRSEPLVANYHAATQGGDPAQYDVRLAAYDVVHVPKIGAAVVFKNYQQYLQQFLGLSVGANASYSINN